MKTCRSCGGPGGSLRSATGDATANLTREGSGELTSGHGQACCYGVAEEDAAGADWFWPGATFISGGFTS